MKENQSLLLLADNFQYLYHDIRAIGCGACEVIMRMRIVLFILSNNVAIARYFHWTLW